MIDRLRFLLDRPLDPLAARAIVVFATAILTGFVAVFALGSGESGHSVVHREQTPPAGSQPGLASRHAPVEVAPAPKPGAHQRRQDPQDEKNTSAARSATKALRSHRALQHVPYRRGGVSIQLVGARGDRAVLRVSAATARGARRGWHRYLHRYRDSGRAYIPIFDVGAGRNG
jgi:hypothetical protein